MNRWCGIHRGYVRKGNAQIVGATETGSGPGQPAYACIDCIRSQGLVPVTEHRSAAFEATRDGSPQGIA